MQEMIDKLEQLKIEATSLKYKDYKGLDAIIRMTKVYIGNLFPDKPDYLVEVSKISFSLPIYIGGADNLDDSSWRSGMGQLINLLDARIQEAKLALSSNLSNNEVDEVTDLKKKIFWLRIWITINYGVILPIVIAIIGGAFTLGLYFGNNRFDQQKITLLEENKAYKSKIDSLLNSREKVNKPNK